MATAGFSNRAGEALGVKVHGQTDLVVNRPRFVSAVEVQVELVQEA
jgi:hypothetical protein